MSVAPFSQGNDDFSVDAEGSLPGKKHLPAVSTGGIYSFEGLQLQVSFKSLVAKTWARSCKNMMPFEPF